MDFVISQFFNPIRVKALLILVLLSFASALYDFIEGKSNISLPLLCLYFIFSVVYCFWSTYLIVHLRGVIKKYKNPDRTGELGVWGYVWRSWLVCFISSMLVILIIMVLLGIHFDKTKFSDGIFYSLLNVTLIPISCWVFFSNNRKQQIFEALKILRGY